MLAHSGYVMTLANSIIGVGILAMPFCFQKCGVVLSVVLLILSSWITRICCHYLIKTSLLTRRKSFELLGFHAFGTSGKLLVELCIIGYLLGTCITYFVVVGDLGPQIVSKMFSLENDHHHLRTLIMCGVTLFCVIPLGMLKNVDSLSTVCTASIGFYVCLVVKIILESKPHVVANDWTERVVYWQPSGVLQCLPIFSMALSCQMQIFEVFTSINNQSLDKLNSIVRNATWICTFVYIAVGFFGYVAFCTQTFSGNILVNLSQSFGSDVIKIGFVLSVAFSFPLVIFPCRASLYSLLYRKGQMDVSAYIPEARFKTITVFIVIFSFGVALMIPSVELVIGLVGSTIGVAICIMFPAACFRKIIRKDTTERTLAQFIVIGGFCLMILGTYANLSAIDEKNSGSHLELPKIDENLLKSTELPKDLIDEQIKNIEKAIEKKFAKEEENKNLLGAKETIVKINISHITPNVEKPVPPPMPVDESHSSNDVKVKEDAIKLPKLMQAEEKPASNVNLDAKMKIMDQDENRNLTDLKIENKQPQIDKSPNNTKTTSNLEIQQQTIDNDAIKKDEDIAKEEQKLQKKQENEELKKTKEELEKTKDLLEKKVEELKEELVKQNQETQNLVAEKLGEVVEKFEQIERKVQQKEQDVLSPSSSEPPKIGPEIDANIANDMNGAKPNKGPLISILTDNRNVTNQSVNETVYEPLSYKTGELIEHVRNVSNVDKRLPLPLALLINASQAKINETLKPKLVNNENQVKLKVSNLTVTNHTKDLEKINVDSIRREILELRENKEDIMQKSQNSEKDNRRIKRSYHNEKKENCLIEPKIELDSSLMASSLTGGLEMTIGRELKSLKDQD